VRDEYLQGARDQLGTIAELAERLIASGDDTAAIEALRRDAHRLRGSAGSFGYPQASVVAAELEEAAKHWIEHPGQRSRGPRPGSARIRPSVAAALFTKQSGATPVAAPSPPIDVIASSPPPSGDVPEVIVVEDDDTLAELLTFGLEARGYRYVLFRNGREALDQLKLMETTGAERPPFAAARCRSPRPRRVLGLRSAETGTVRESFASSSRRCTAVRRSSCAGSKRARWITW